MIASSRIFWMYLTTGASSTSASSSTAVGLRRRPRGRPRCSSRFAMSLSDGAARLDELARSPAPSLSSSTTTGSTHEVGLEPDLLQRLQVGRVRHRDEQPVAALVQRQHAARLRDLGVEAASFWSWSRSNAARSSSGTPNAREPNTASCCAVIRLPGSSCSTNVMPDCCACVCSASASSSDMRPCCASARARPLRLRVAAWVAIEIAVEIGCFGVVRVQRGAWDPSDQASKYAGAPESCRRVGRVIPIA